MGAGTINVSGDAVTSFRPNPPEDIVAITVSGDGTYSSIEAWRSVGTITVSGNAVTSIESEKLASGSGNINVSGDATYKQIEAWNGAGTINVSGTGIPFIEGEKLASGSGTITISGAATYKQIEAWNGSGTITALRGAAESRAYSYNRTSAGSDTYGLVVDPSIYFETYGLVANTTDQISDYGGLLDGPSPFGTINVSGDSTYSSIEAWRSVGTITVSGIADTVFRPNPPENTVNITVSGAATYKQSEAWLGSGNIDVSGVADTVFRPNPPEDTVTISVSGDATYIQVEAWRGSGTINVSGSVQQFGNPLYSGSGTITASGAATYKQTEIFIGSGNIDVSGDAKTIFTPNSPEETVVINVSGDSTYKQIEAWRGSGTINVSGIATCNPAEAFGGSGTLNTLRGAAEVYGPNPPEDIVLINVSGSATYKQVEAWLGSGNIDVSGNVIPFAIPSYPASGIINVSGIATCNPVEAFRGTGTISALSGAAEVKGSNPPENTLPITVSGAATYNQTETFVGSGNIDISGAITPAIQIYVPKFTGNCEIRISGNAITKETNPAEYATGGIEIFGTAGWNYTRLGYQGSGSLTALSGAAEVKVSNPPEDTVLATISGSASTRYFNVYTGVGSGSIQISGGITPQVQVYVPEYTGSGTIQISGSGRTPTSRIAAGIGGTISISGIGNESFTRSRYIGSGLFSIFGGRAEVIGANPPENIVPLTVSGSAVLKERFSYTASGIATISGNAAWNYSRTTYQGSGTIGAFSGSAEVKVSNPPENIVLFTITGNSEFRIRSSVSAVGVTTISGTATQRLIDSNVGIGTVNISGAATYNRGYGFAGSGIISISGQATPIRTFAYNGSGTINTLSGVAEVNGSNPPEGTVAIVINGSASTRYFNVKTVVGGGTLQISGAIPTDRQIFVPSIPGTGTIQISGSAKTPRGRNYNSSGEINIFRSGKESYARTTYIGSGQLNISGIGAYEYRKYEPPFIYVTII